ncbi:hypothetical protein OAE93_01455, partial [bacterium]|nr:hypothetical protein [bacterium]
DMGYSYGYRPTTLASFAIEKSLFGESATVSHAVNLALYLATCLLIFFLIKRVFPDKIDVALFAALLFTVHPIHTEVVASIKNRDEILSLLFMLLAFWFFLKSKTNDSIVKKIIVLVSGGILIGLSISSKLSAASILVLLPLALNKTFQIPLRILAYSSVVFVLDRLITQRSNNSFVHPGLFALSLAIIDVASSKSLRDYVTSAMSRFGREIRETVDQAKSKITLFKAKFNTHFNKRWELWKIALIHRLKSVFTFTSTYISLLWNSVFPPDVGKVIFRLSVEVPSVLIMLMLFFALGIKSVVVLLISWKLTTLLSRKLQIWILNNGVILMLALAFSDSGTLITFVLPIILFKNYLSPAQTKPKFIHGLSLLGIGLALASIDLLITALTDGSLFVSSMLFAIYSLTLISSLILKMTTHYGVGKNIFFQIGMSVLFLLVGFLIIPQAGFDLIFTQIGPIINLILTLSSLNSYELSNKLKTKSIKLVLGLFVLIQSAYSIHRAEQTIIDTSVLIMTTVANIEGVGHNSFENLRLSGADITSEVHFTFKNYEEIWITPFQRSWNRTIANSISPVKFDSTYVENTVTQLKTISADVGRPLDFTENPISPFASFPVKLGLAITNTSRLLANLVVPLELCFYYGFNEIWVTNLLETPTLIILFLLLGMSTTGFVLIKNSNPLAGITLLMTLVCLVPFSGIIEPLPGIYAPRFSYVASFFFCISATELFTSWSLPFGNKSKALLHSTRFFAFITLIVIGAFSASRNLDWKNKITLMTKDIKFVPNSAQAHNLLAHALMENAFSDGYLSATEKVGKVSEAAFHFERATEIYPQFFNAWVDLGRVNIEINEPQKAISAFEKALAEDSTYTPILGNLAVLNEQLGRKDRAIFYYRKHIKIGLAPFEVYDALARILYDLGRYEESIIVCEQYLKIAPSNTDFQRNISMMQEFLDSTPSEKTNLSN